MKANTKSVVNVCAFQCDASMIEAIDTAARRELLPRSAWVRRAAMRELERSAIESGKTLATALEVR